MDTSLSYEVPDGEAASKLRDQRDQPGAGENESISYAIKAFLARENVSLFEPKTLSINQIPKT